MLHDWSSYLIQVEQHIRQINDKLLHKHYQGIDEQVATIKDNLDNMLRWVNEQEDKPIK